MNIVKKKIRRLLFLTTTINALLVLLIYSMIVHIFNTNLADAWPISLMSFGKSKVAEKRYDVLGFAPYWKIGKMTAVDFNILSTLAYFDVPIDAQGNIVKDSPGYYALSREATQRLFADAKKNGVKVIVTLTQMDNQTIEEFLAHPEARTNAISQINHLVANHHFDGVNIDFEYFGSLGDQYRDTFSRFVAHLSSSLHSQGHFVSTSVYASALRDPRIYDISSLSKSNDKIFMMAYDFSTTASDNAIPTAPLYGHREGSYWYDIATAVEDFLTQMPAEKLILGTPWYGYNLLVYQPQVKAETRPWYSWRGQPTVQTYGEIQDSVTPDMTDIADFKEGWDDLGKVSWRAYLVASTNTWRMVFFDDVRSLSLKYDFAKAKRLGGVGMWALGYEEGRHELWDLLHKKFGPNSDNKIISKNIHE